MSYERVERRLVDGPKPGLPTEAREAVIPVLVCRERRSLRVEVSGVLRTDLYRRSPNSISVR
jgi:hypothetical protein